MKPGLYIILALASQLGYSQESAKSFNRLSVGIGAGQYLFDPGITATLTTPHFNNGRFALRFSGGIRWSEMHFIATNQFASYSGAQIGLVFRISQLESVRIYSETGVNFIFPNTVFSTKKDVAGFYAALGSDFFVFTIDKFDIAYFVELGVTLNPARAEKLERQPLYSNGLTSATGFRFHL